MSIEGNGTGRFYLGRRSHQSCLFGRTKLLYQKTARMEFAENRTATPRIGGQQIDTSRFAVATSTQMTGRHAGTAGCPSNTRSDTDQLGRIRTSKKSVGADSSAKGRKAAPKKFDQPLTGTELRFLVCNKCENTACRSSEALSSSRLSLLSMWSMWCIIRLTA